VYRITGSSGTRLRQVTRLRTCSHCLLSCAQNTPTCKQCVRALLRLTINAHALKMYAEGWVSFLWRTSGTSPRRSFCGYATCEQAVHQPCVPSACAIDGDTWRPNSVRNSTRPNSQGMVAAGLHSIIIKVACLGLNEKHLGKSIATIEPIMLRLAERYGCNVCGEGGEFETLTLDGPMFPQGSIQMLVRTDSSAAAGSSSMLW
jgi:hypothetical protein